MTKKNIILGLIAALFLAIFISPYASKLPDGLEKVAEIKGFLDKAKTSSPLSSPFSDYHWQKLKNEKLSTSLVGAVGTVLVFIVGYGVGMCLKKYKKNKRRLKETDGD